MMVVRLMSLVHTDEGDSLILWHRDMKESPYWHVTCEYCGWDKLGPVAAVRGKLDLPPVDRAISEMEARISSVTEYEQWMRDCYRHMTYHCDPY